MYIYIYIYYIYMYNFLYIFLYIQCDSVSYLSIHLTSLFSHLRFLFIQTENAHVLFILVHLCIYVFSVNLSETGTFSLQFVHIFHLIFAQEYHFQSVALFHKTAFRYQVEVFTEEITFSNVFLHVVFVIVIPQLDRLMY